MTSSFQVAMNKCGPRPLRSWLKVKDQYGTRKTPFIIERHLGFDVGLERPLCGTADALCQKLDLLLSASVFTQNDIPNLVMCKGAIKRFAIQTDAVVTLFKKINKILERINPCPVMQLPRDLWPFLIQDIATLNVMRKVCVQCKDLKVAISPKLKSLLDNLLDS